MVKRIPNDNDTNEKRNYVQDMRLRSIRTWILIGTLLSPLLVNLFWGAKKSAWIYWGARVALGVEAIIVGALFLFIPGDVFRWATRNLLFSRRITSPENWTSLQKARIAIFSLVVISFGTLLLWIFYTRELSTYWPFVIK